MYANISYPLSIDKAWLRKLKVIAETRRARLIWYPGFYCYHKVDTTPDKIFVSHGIVNPVVSASALTWLIKYICLSKFSS